MLHVFYGISIPDNLLHSSCAHWTDFVAREAERHGFAWAYWEFCSGFGVYDRETGQWKNELLTALFPD
jgi:endoglucanase